MAVVAAVCAIAVIVVTQGGSDPPAIEFTSGQDIPPDLDPNARLEPPDSESDPNIEYPEAVSELLFPPSHLAVDPSTGDLSFVGFTYNGETNDLYHYTRSGDKLDRFEIPASNGSQFFSDIAVNSRGEVISAEGDLVLIVDPDGGYREIRLPPPENFAKRKGWDGTYVIDMELDGDDNAYLTRMNTAAITELDLQDGSVNEIPLDPSLGQFQKIALAGDQLWMTTIYATETTASTTAVMDVNTKTVEVTGIVTSALVDDGQGRVFVSRQTEPAVVAVDERDAALEAGPWTFTREHDGLQWNPRLLAVDKEQGRIWMAGGGSGIVSVEPSSGREEYYGLPSVAETMPFSAVQFLIPCPTPREDDCWNGRPSFTSVDGIAVGPNGDLYFADATFNRIGIVHPR